jgi:hypothetical protein
VLIPAPASLRTERQAAAMARLFGASGLAELCRAIEDLGQSLAQNRRQVLDLVAAWRLVPSGVWWRLGTNQTVELCIYVQGGVLIIVRAD